MQACVFVSMHLPEHPKATLAHAIRTRSPAAPTRSRAIILSQNYWVEKKQTR